jgi:multidrug efflux pump subunit AcrA (membrane-fusion protein)
LDIVETSEALKKYQNQQQTMRLYAPIAGFVQEISINTIGGVVTSAQELMHTPSFRLQQNLDKYFQLPHQLHRILYN